MDAMLEDRRGVGEEADRMIVLGCCCSPYHDFLNLLVSPGKGFQNSKFWMPGDFFFHAGLLSRLVAEPTRVSISSWARRSAVIETLHTAGLQWRL